MVCCNICSAWQHNDCMGLSEDEDELPERYFCENCKPEHHKGLLAAIARGERPWEEATKRQVQQALPTTPVSAMIPVPINSSTTKPGATVWPVASVSTAQSPRYIHSSTKSKTQVTSSVPTGSRPNKRQKLSGRRNDSPRRDI